MSLKKVNFKEDEESLFDEVLISKRGEYWYMRMWLANEHKYARFSLKTKNKSTARDKAKLHYHELMANQLAGKSYFSKTTKVGVEMYLEERAKDVEAKIIVKGRHATIKTQLNNWLNVIGRDTKLRELERTDCQNYFYDRSKTKKKIPVSQSTIENEQSIINAMMKWLFSRGETYIDKFEFKKLKRIDKGIDSNRRATFTDSEVERIKTSLSEYISEAEKDINTKGNLTKAITGYYLGFSLISGLRRGEQLQLRWCDITEMEHKEARNKKFELVKITVRGETSKVKKTRQLIVKDFGYVFGLLNLKRIMRNDGSTESNIKEKLDTELMFSSTTKNAITARSIGYHFDRIMEKAKIENLQTRDLVPYSFRHYFITRRVNSKIPVAVVAELCGTSIAQIEKTYYHTTDDKMVSNALSDYEIVDGVMIHK